MNSGKIIKSNVDLTKIGKIKMYGDRMGDGAIQMSFTLPMPICEEARLAGQKFVENMGLKRVSVLHMEAIDPEFTFFVVYASNEAELDVSQLKAPKLEYPEYSFDEVNTILQEKVGRRLTILGACIGTDAHTVGIDAIFNMKGYRGSHGLERYSAFKAINLRAQVDIKDLADKIEELKADAVLVSRVVTQRDSHLVEFTNFINELKTRAHLPKHLIKICGGPRITHKEAKEMGYDAGFGPGTLPHHVASYMATEFVTRLSKSNPKKDVL